MTAVNDSVVDGSTGEAIVLLGSVPEPRGWQTPIGTALVEAGVIDAAQLQDALALQARWRSRLGDVVLAQRGVTALRFYTVLSAHFGLNFVNLLQQPIDSALFEPQRLADYAQRLVLPWRQEEGRLVLAVADPGPETFAWARNLYGEDVRFVGTSKFDIVWGLQQQADAQLTHDALNLLAEHAPEHSAKQVITRRQVVFLWALVLLLSLVLVLWPVPSLITINTVIGVGFLATFCLKFVLAWRGAHRRIDIKVSDEEVAALGDEDLPVYTVLVPMYKEPDVLPILANALRRLDYPTSKLDVKLVLEADDIETIEAAKALGLERSSRSSGCRRRSPRPSRRRATTRCSSRAGRC